MRLPRFLKGTTDHDSDGKMGGSLRAKRRTTMAKTTTKRTRTTKEQAAELDAAATTMATAPDPQTGGVSVISDDTPTQAQVRKARQATLENQFAEADGKGQPTSEEIVDTNLRLAARGY